jgi:hypothetical protein
MSPDLGLVDAARRGDGVGDAVTGTSKSAPFKPGNQPVAPVKPAFSPQRPLTEPLIQALYGLPASVIRANGRGSWGVIQTLNEPRPWAC